MRVSILGRRWNLRFVPRSRKRGHYGRCDPPEAANRSITIEQGHAQQTELDVALHEFLHAGAFDVLDEEFVKRWATDVSRILIRLGWRKINGDQDTEV